MNKSESISNLAKALAEFQQEVKNPTNTAEHPVFHSKYAQLSDVLSLTRPLLAKHGLSIMQSPSGDGNSIAVSTILMHTSGEWIEADPLILKPEKATAQGAGSAITYARRYALSALLGISSDDDDDGTIASTPSTRPTTTQQPKPSVQTQQSTQARQEKKPFEKKDGCISEAQAKRLFPLAKGDRDIVITALETYGYSTDTLNDITNADYRLIDSMIVDAVKAKENPEAVDTNTDTDLPW